MEETTQMPQNSDLTPGLNLEITYEYATQGQRFLNFLIDYLLMKFGLSFLTARAVGFILAIVAPKYMESLVYTLGWWDRLLITYMVWIINYLFYYTICEKGFRGYTLGKLITGTRAIREDGGELTFKDAILRSLSRLVPLETFSAFGGYPWHDSWTKTKVIKAR